LGPFGVHFGGLGRACWDSKLDIFLVCAQAQGSLLTFGPERVVGVGMGSHLWPIPFSPIHLKVSDRKETQNLAIYTVLGTPGPRRCDS
jgi:hypothetical protein